MLSLFIGSLLPVQADLGIALTMSDAGHSQIHTDLGALAGKVGTQTLDDLLGSALRNADHMLGSPAHLALLLGELRGGNTALGALLGGILALEHITANLANPLLHSKDPPYVFQSSDRFSLSSSWDGLSITVYSNVLKLLLQLLKNFSKTSFFARRSLACNPCVQSQSDKNREACASLFYQAENPDYSFSARAFASAMAFS